MLFYECSAKNDINVEEAFRNLAEQALKRQLQPETKDCEKDKPAETEDLEKEKPAEPEKCEKEKLAVETENFEREKTDTSPLEKASKVEKCEEEYSDKRNCKDKIEDCDKND